MDIIFANQFYIKAKGRDLAVRLVCGATYLHLSGYLLIQTLLLLLCAAPLGFGLGMVMLPVSEKLLFSFSASAYHLTIHAAAIGEALLIIGYVVFWIILLNMSFSYQNAQIMLTSNNVLHGSTTVKKSALLKIKMIAGAVLYLLPLVFFYGNPYASTVSVIVGLVGLYFVLRYDVPLWLGNRIEKNYDSPMKLAVLGMIRQDLSILKYNIFLLIFTSVIFAGLFAMNREGIIGLIVLVSYIVMVIMQVLALMFRFATSAAGRKKNFAILRHLGYEETQLIGIMKKEVWGVYGIVMVFTLLYIINLSAAYLKEGIMPLPVVCLLVGVPVLVSFFAALTDLMFYRKAVL